MPKSFERYPVYVQNKKVIATIKWLHEHSLGMDMMTRLVLVILTGIICFVALSHLPTYWGWGMVIGQGLAYALIVRLTDDIIWTATNMRSGGFHWCFVRYDDFTKKWSLKIWRGIWDMTKITGCGLFINLAGTLVVGLVGGIILGGMWVWENFLQHHWFPTVCVTGGIVALYIVVKTVLMANEARKINKMIIAWHPKGTKLSEKIESLIKSSQKSASREESLLKENSSLNLAVKAMTAKMLEGSVILVPRGGKPSNDSVQQVGASLEQVVRAHSDVVPNQKVDATLYGLREEERRRLQEASRKSAA